MPIMGYFTMILHNKEKVGPLRQSKQAMRGWGWALFVASQLYSNFLWISEIAVNYYDLYDDLPTKIVVTSQFALTSNQGNYWDIFETFCSKGPTLF